MLPLRFVLVSIGVAGCLGLAPPIARAAEPSPVAETTPVEEEVFHYPLRPGESLNEVSRIFRVPVAELVERNRIVDPDRLVVGRILAIPNAFGREVVFLRSERDRLLAEKERLEQVFAERETAIAMVDARVEELETARAALDHELSRMTRWQNAAKTVVLVLLGVFVWGLKVRTERSLLDRKLGTLAAEKEALFAAKEKYRLAASQLELRYQQLYRGKGEAPREVVDDGITRLNRTFREAAKEVEALLAKMETERAKQEQLLEARQKIFAWVFHPFRQIVTRHRLKYRTP